jgi:GT2 family glycosyltransferase
MLIPCPVFREVGLFDESLFLFYEDSDFCRRVRDHGYRIVCVGHSPIFHKVSASTGGQHAPVTLRIRARNRIRFYRRYRHGPSPALTMLAIAIVALWRVLGYAATRRQLIRPYLGGLLSGLREPPTAPQYPWPELACAAGHFVSIDRAAHAA